MNKLIIALSVACASACVLAEPTSYDKLQFDDPINWFGAKVDNGQLALDKLVPFGVGLKVEGDMLVVETDADTMEAVTLQAEAERSKDITTVTFDMLASTVPSESLKGKDTMSAKGKIAFAIAGEDETRGFKAWLGGDSWEALTGVAAPDDEAPYKLIVRFDSREGVNKVCFEVVINSSGTVLKKTSETADDGWYGYGEEPVSAAVAIDLIGSGKIASILGVENPIKAEVINVGDLGNLVVPEEIAKAYPDLTKTDPDLKADVNVATAVALGLLKVENGKIVKDTTTDFTVKANATAKYSEAIPVIFPHFDPANVPATTDISYQLMGSVDGSGYSVVKIGDKETVDNVADVKIPATAIGAGKRYFKVVTKVSVRDPNP